MSLFDSICNIGYHWQPIAVCVRLFVVYLYEDLEGVTGCRKESSHLWKNATHDDEVVAKHSFFGGRCHEDD